MCPSAQTHLDISLLTFTHQRASRVPKWSDAARFGRQVVPINGWAPAEQSLKKVFEGLESAACSDAPLDAAKAGEAAGHMATDALPARGAGAGASSSSDCRILFISSPEALGVTVGEAGGAAARVAAAVEQARTMALSQSILISQNVFINKF